MKFTISLISIAILLSASVKAMDDRTPQSQSLSIGDMRQQIDKFSREVEEYSQKLNGCLDLFHNYPQQEQTAMLYAQNAYDAIDLINQQSIQFQKACQAHNLPQAVSIFNSMFTLDAQLKTIKESLIQLLRSASNQAASSTSSTTSSSDQPAPAGPAQQQINCPVCFDDKNITECVRLSCPDHHTYCKKCLVDMLNKAVRDFTIPLQCPECKTKITEQDVREITNDPTLRQEFDERTYQEWLRTQPNAKNCPTPNCKFVFLNENGIRETIRCNQCQQFYCSNCYKNHSSQISCEEAEANSRMPGDPEAATKEWRRQNTKQCPKCHVDIEKDGGCLHMTCNHCWHQFCWRCLKRWPCPTSNGYYICNGVDTRQLQQQPMRIVLTT